MRRKMVLALLTIVVFPLTIFALTGSGESNIFEISDQTLPVVLSSFSAFVTTDSNVQLNWVTQSEKDLSGYYIYRNLDENLEEASLISNLIPPSNSSTEQNYSFQDTYVENNVTYFYWLQSLNLDGTNDYYGPLSILVNQEEEEPSLPQQKSLLVVYPNPVNKGSNVKFSINLKQDEMAELSIFNIRGQKIRSYEVNSGSRIIQWNGKDSNGLPCSNGIYFLKINSLSYYKNTKFLLLK